MFLIPTVYAASEAAASAGGISGVAESLGLNVQLFLAQLINFAILAVGLWYLLFKPLTLHMEERSKRIAAGLEKEKEYSEKLKGIGAERQTVLFQAENERRVILNTTQEEIKRLHEKARAEAETLKQQARAHLSVEAEQMKQQSLNEIRSSAAELVVLAAEKVLQERVDEKKDRELIERALKEINL